MKQIFTLLILSLCTISGFSCTSNVTIAPTTRDTLCAGQTLAFTAGISGGSGPDNIYRWQVNSINVNWPNQSLFRYAPAAGDIITCVVTDSCGTFTSNSISPVVLPVLNQLPAATFCGGYGTTPINLYGGSWTNSNTSIGLVASGTSNIPSFTATNNTTQPITAIITAIQTCTVTDTAVFSIIINPIPGANAPANQVVCSGDTTSAVTLVGTLPYEIFRWVGSNSSIGLPDSGTGNIPSFTTINAGSNPIIDTITINPYTSGYAYMTDAINGYAYAVSRAADSLIASISGIGGFFGFSVGITVSSDGTWTYIANNGANTVSVLDNSTSTLAATINVGAYPYGIVISPDEKYVYVTNSGDGTVSVIDVVTTTVVDTITLPGGPPSNPEGIAVSPDGSNLFVSCGLDTGLVYFISTATNSVYDSVTVGSNPSGIIVSPDGNRVYVANYTSSDISTITVSSRTVTQSAMFTSTSESQIESNGLALSPDGLTLYASSFWDGTVVYYNTATNPPTLLGTIDLPGGAQEAPVGLSVSADGLYLYASNCGDGPAPNYSTLEVISTATKTVISSDTIVNPDGEEISYSFGNFVTGINCDGPPITFTITVNPTGGTPSVSLSISGSDTICIGQQVTFTATPANVSSPNYTFVVNGNPAQTGASATYVTDSLRTGDVIACVMRATTCGGSATDTSNSITMTIGVHDTASVTISANPSGAVCAGTEVTFTANAFNGGLSPAYQWQLNGQNIGTGSDTLLSSSLQNGDTVICVLTSSLSCVAGSPANSNLLQMQVNPLPVVGSISASLDSVCMGDTSILSVIDTSPVQWQSSLTDSGFTDVPGATSGTYPAIMTQTTYYRVYASMGGCSDTSGAFLLFLKPSPPSPVAIAADSAFCPGFGTQICAPDSFAAYKWNTGDTTFCIVTRQAGDYHVTVTATNGCKSVSSSADISVYPTPQTSISQSGDTLFSFGEVSYQWLRNGDSIPGANAAFYVAINPGNYSVQITDTNGCTATSNAFVVSNIASVGQSRLTLYPNPNGEGKWQMVADIELIGSVFEVLDAEGRCILNSEIKAENSQLELNVAAGVYLLLVHAPSGIVTRRLVRL